MVYINFTNVTAANNTLEIIVGIDKTTNGIFSLMLIITIFAIIFINQSYYHTKNALLVTGFITSIITGFLWLAGLVQFYIFIVVNVLLLVFVIIAFIDKSGG